jgi:uncharacterized protein YbcC (UPF0753/DUF2309 family)
MGVYTATISSNSSSFLEVNSTNVSYDEIKESFAANAYLIKKMYIIATNRNQIQQSYLFQNFDSNGNQKYTNLVFPIDPYQKQSAIIKDLKDQKVVFNGRSSLAFPVLPNERMKITFYYERVNLSSFLNEYQEDNFKDTEKDMNDWNFFGQYNDIIPDI